VTLCPWALRGFWLLFLYWRKWRR